MLFSGTIEKGKGTGTILGFPTANIPLTDTSVSGIYAGRVVIENHTYQAVIYADQRRNLLESHLLDFSGSLYGKNIQIELLTKLREDETFPDVDSLKAQIAKDIISARDFFIKDQV